MLLLNQYDVVNNIRKQTAKITLLFLYILPFFFKKKGTCSLISFILSPYQFLLITENIAQKMKIRTIMIAAMLSKLSE